MRELISAAVVIAGRHFNPSVIGELWLHENQVFSKAELESADPKIFTENFAQLGTEKIDLTVLPPQLQLLVKSAEPPSDDSLLYIRRIVNLIPHTPFTGVGMNFIWNVNRVGIDVREMGRDLFLRNDRPFAKFFDTADCFFGGYFSKDILGCRLKLDVKPHTFVGDGISGDFFIFSFNFHLDLSGSGEQKVLAINKHLDQWEFAKVFSDELTEEIAGEET